MTKSLALRPQGVKYDFVPRARTLKDQQERRPTGFDLFRINAAKIEVGCTPNTIRSYIRQGLKCYKVGKAMWISRSELSEFIRKSNGEKVPQI